ncbi:carboxypeptidase-like regulatory domain-containing protein [Tamlana fucoidanivorans]|nr:carboxypeptidase-like regulatory domain-containing protein [Tamlana fucoidanivorans]
MKSSKLLKLKFKHQLLMLFMALLTGTTMVSAQELTINGTVVDESGVPLAGANIVEKNTTHGAQTDFDGNFSLKTSSNAVLVVSYFVSFPKNQTTFKTKK